MPMLDRKNTEPSAVGTGERGSVLTCARLMSQYAARAEQQAAPAGRKRNLITSTTPQNAVKAAKRASRPSCSMQGERDLSVC